MLPPTLCQLLQPFGQRFQVMTKQGGRSREHGRRSVSVKPQQALHAMELV